MRIRPRRARLKDMDSKRPRPTTPEEEGIELYPDAMERLKQAVKTAARHGAIAAGAIKKAGRTRVAKPSGTASSKVKP